MGSNLVRRIDAEHGDAYDSSIPTGLRCGAIPRDYQPGPHFPEGSPIPCPNLVPTSVNATVDHDAERR